MKKSFIKEAEGRINQSARAFISKPTKKNVNKKNSTGMLEIEGQTKETKSKALCLLIRPSVYEALKNEAYKKNLSINETANRIFELYIKGR
jgi:hypothetical protein